MDSMMTAVVCEAGHVIEAGPKGFSPREDDKFCHICSAPAVRSCSACKIALRGAVEGSYLDYQPPAYCYACSAPFPWTEQRLKAADELIDLLDGLTDADRTRLRSAIPDLLTDTPRTAPAAITLVQLAKKAGEVGILGLKQILADAVGGTALAIFKSGLGW